MPELGRQKDQEAGRLGVQGHLQLHGAFEGTGLHGSLSPEFTPYISHQVTKTQLSIFWGSPYTNTLPLHTGDFDM